MLTVKERLESVQDELELEIAEFQLKQIRDQKDLLEVGQDMTGQADGHLFDDPNFRNDPRIFGGRISMLTDRVEGRNEPFFRDETEHAEIRGDGRMLANQNEAGIGIRNLLTNFTIGTGYKYKYSAKDDSDSALAEFCQEWDDEFSERVNWRTKEREAHQRSIPDGEWLLKLEPLPGGRTDCLYREPDALTEPNRPMEMSEVVGEIALDWTFGVATPIGRPHEPIVYFIDLTGDQRDWELVQPQFMVHGKRNVVENVKRGMSDYFPVSASLRRADKILRNTGEGAALQSAIAWIREHPPGTTGTQILNLGSGKTELEINRTTPEGILRTHRFQRYLPGTILDVKGGTSYKPGPMGEGTVFVDVGEAMLRYAAFRWAIPEGLMSAVSSDANFAAQLVLESPFVKCIETEQVGYEDKYRETKWKMLAIAMRAGRMNKFGVRSLGQLKSRVVMNVTKPRVSVRNKLEETQISSVLHQFGLLSSQTWSQKEELDRDHEKANLEKDPPLNTDNTAGGVLKTAGVPIGLGDKQFQQQANEPGNKGQSSDRRGNNSSRSLGKKNK